MENTLILKKKKFYFRKNKPLIENSYFYINKKKINRKIKDKNLIINSYFYN